ncbi:MAG: DUF4397 domain-containing protein [Candidatus Thermoplasmatota archaeon]|nr:DUF4397 domain-containing protein [Candidatus Thermoplasmatota archaeon]
MRKGTITAAMGITLMVLLGSMIMVGQVEGRGMDKENNGGGRGFGGSSWASARVRAVHLSPDAPAVDIWVNGNLAVSNLAFGEYTPYLTVPFNKGGSSYNIQVVPTGQTSPIVINADVVLKPVRDYTIVAVGKLSEIEPLVIEDLRPVRPIFRSWVRFVHASPDAPAVDIAVKDGPVLFPDVSFGDVERYLSVKAGTYDLEVRLAGTETVVLSVDDVSLMKRTSYTVFATGLVSPGTGEPSLGALLVKDR